MSRPDEVAAGWQEHADALAAGVATALPGVDPAWPAPAQLQARLAAEITEQAGPWAPTFAAVPRHVFVPDRIWRHDRHSTGTGDLVPLSRRIDPQAWLAAVYRDAPVGTQVDDGHPAPDGTGYEVTSSTSQPSVMADMLTALDLDPLDGPALEGPALDGVGRPRVLEIGTGTGWNAALLAHRLGATRVVSVEVDPQVASDARVALRATGFAGVQVVTGDGAHGYPPGAPYDRVIATAGVRTVPYPWVAQTRPGGRIVVPLVGTLQSPGVLALDVDAGGTATGRLCGPASFMALRAQRIPRPRVEAIDVDTGEVSITDIHPHHVSGDRAAATVVDMRVPGLYRQYDPGPVDGHGTAWLLHPTTGSWSAFALTPDPPWQVRQGGPRRVWDDAVDAYWWWLEAGSPPVTAWRWTVGPNGQRVELAPQMAPTT